MVYHRGNGRGGRRWLTIEAKSYEISMEGAGRRKQFFITEKKQGRDLMDPVRRGKFEFIVEGGQ